jgi:hypothetical protein
MVSRKCPLPRIMPVENLETTQELTAGQLPYTINFITMPRRDGIIAFRNDEIIPSCAWSRCSQVISVVKAE